MKYFTVPLTGLEWTGRIFGFSSWSMSCPSELLILWSGRRCFRIGFKTLFTTESDSSKHKQTNKIKSNKIKESELTKKKINNSESKWWKHSGPLETVSNLTRSSLNQTKLPHPNNKYHFVKSSIFFSKLLNRVMKSNKPSHVLHKNSPCPWHSKHSIWPWWQWWQCSTYEIIIKVQKTYKIRIWEESLCVCVDEKKDCF